MITPGKTPNSAGEITTNGSNGDTNCTYYCNRADESPFNNELSREWNGAECVRTTDGTPCGKRPPGRDLGCVCRATGRGWYGAGPRYSDARLLQDCWWVPHTYHYRSRLITAVVVVVLYKMCETRNAKHTNEVLPSEICNWVSGFVETPKSAMALATVRKSYDNHCGYINCWVDGRSLNCETACVCGMYNFCRIVAEIASKLWQYVNEFNEFILHPGFFNLRIGSDSNENSGGGVVFLGGDTGHIYFQCGDLGHSFDGRTSMPTCCLADEL